MMIDYECKINLEDYVDEEWTKEDVENAAAVAKKAILKAGYNWFQDGDEIEICGEVYDEVCGEKIYADEVANDIKQTLWNSGEFDVDVKTREFEWEDCREFERDD